MVGMCSSSADIGTVLNCVKAFAAISATICAASLCRETPSARAGLLNRRQWKENFRIKGSLVGRPYIQRTRSVSVRRGRHDGHTLRLSAFHGEASLRRSRHISDRAHNAQSRLGAPRRAPHTDRNVSSQRRKREKNGEETLHIDLPFGLYYTRRGGPCALTRLVLIRISN